MKVMFFSNLIYIFFGTCVLFKDTFILIRWNFLFAFSIFLVYLIRLIRLSSDIKLNSGPKPSSYKFFSICNWNLNNITSHDFFKVKLLTTSSVMHKLDTICIYESYLNSGISSSIDKLDIFGNNMSPADHPSENRRWGVFIYYKASLSIKMLNINYIQECICFDLKIESKHCTILSLYRSSSWSANKIEFFFKQIKSGSGINYSKQSASDSCYWRF